MRTYTPRRAGRHWLEGAPAYVLDCFDNKGKTCDRYTVIFGKEFMNTSGREHWLATLDMSGAPTHPQGVSMWGEYKAHEIANYRYKCGHDRVRWLDLPEHIREHVIARVEEC